jgi:hypothetical protein
MASLHPAPTFTTAAYSNIKTTHHRLPYNVFLILRLATLCLHAAAAMRAQRRQGDGDLFINALRNRATGVAAVLAACLPARPFGIGCWLSARMWCGLPFAGSQRSV